jgi:hypothetical protein
MDVPLRDSSPTFGAPWSAVRGMGRVRCNEQNSAPEAGTRNGVRFQTVFCHYLELRIVGIRIAYYTGAASKFSIQHREI